MEWGVHLLFSVFSDSFWILGHVNVLPIQINKDNSKFKKNLKNIKKIKRIWLKNQTCPFEYTCTYTISEDAHVYVCVHACTFPIYLAHNCRLVFLYYIQFLRASSDQYFFKNWSIPDLQCWVSFWYTAKWFSCSYTYIFFFVFFSIMVYYRILNVVSCAI